MQRQQQGLRAAPTLALIDDADTQARWYYRLKEEYRRARAEGRPFANPVQPRTLRWRSLSRTLLSSPRRLADPGGERADRPRDHVHQYRVIPAKAGIQGGNLVACSWTPLSRG